ncbi:MAG TPA: ribose-phosphate diphosphokinase [Clostridia bacterium]|nr:ribose-phosphate diphosphokinase [Clostridia bacterium]
MAVLKSAKIFAGSSGKEFAQDMCSFLGDKLAESEVITFSEGNTYVKACETVRGMDVYLVQPIGMKPNDEFVEILFWADAFKRASASSVTAIMPYFSYAKADKKDEPRVSIRARVCAECLELAGVDRVVTMDLHSPQVQGFFKKPVDHLHALPVMCEYIKKMNLDDLIVVSPDAGFAKNARKYADYLNTSIAIGDKTRSSHDEKAEILELIGDVKNKTALIVDDFSLSGGTLAELSYLLKDRGAKKIIACLSHIMLSDQGVEKIDKSPIDMLIGTDSVGNKNILKSDKIKLVSVAPLFAQALIRIHNRESVSPLFTSVSENILKQSYK